MWSMIKFQIDLQVKMAEKPSGWLAVLGEKLGFFTGSQLGEQSIFDKVQFE